jgi:6-pyruvoyltetrahydropterin/6-carboxytetrahydropterin synthase
MDLNSINVREVPSGFAYGSSKTYTHSQGLSCTFRQHHAKDTHCRFLHGFEAVELDDRNWVVNFGGLKEVKKWLEDTFDHKTLIATDDPALQELQQQARVHTFRPGPPMPGIEMPQLNQLVEVPAVGIEAFARYIYEYVLGWMDSQSIQTDHSLIPLNERVDLMRVTVSEHEGNSAWYGRDTRQRITMRDIELLVDRKIQQRERSRARTGV